MQCDQIGRFYWTLGNFLEPLAIVNLPKSPTFFGNFCKGVEIYHFSSEIIYRQLFSGHTEWRVGVLNYAVPTLEPAPPPVRHAWPTGMPGMRTDLYVKHLLGPAITSPMQIPAL